MTIEPKTIERLVTICDIVRSGKSTVCDVFDILPNEIRLKNVRSLQKTFNAGVEKGYLKVVGKGKWKRPLYQATDTDTVEDLADQHHRDYQRYMVDKSVNQRKHTSVNNDSGLNQYTHLMMGAR